MWEGDGTNKSFISSSYPLMADPFSDDVGGDRVECCYAELNIQTTSNEDVK